MLWHWTVSITSKKITFIKLSNKNHSKRILIFTLASGILALDQISKAWAASHLIPGISQKWIPFLMRLELTTNTGAAFSLLHNSIFTLTVISFIATISLIMLIFTRYISRSWQALAIALLLGGSLGNGLDRWRLGYVVDFLALVPINFPIFNEADISINLAIICFAVDMLVFRGYKNNHDYLLGGK
uniref:Lipoprotein signal peptidase n=1 Tax=Paulinella chromatophora TaxID=39717 RepID=B1X432_PAUCH|nr:lipoprotein signal peptidase [Paulinella chromatophora]ACB42701.1 lipoprotein signal peptidase [Paulinella chromatophora]